MANHRSPTTRLASLTLSNILIPIAVLVFASGFFPYKPVLPGLASFADDEGDAAAMGMGMEGTGVQGATRPAAVFDRVVFMVVDALRSDFMFGHGSGFEFTQSLIRSGAAIPFTAHATPPTVTMPRVKALTTGSVPSFLDLILNFAESDTTSSLALQDTWLAQIKAHGRSRHNISNDGGGGGSIVFYGDDTWLKLFPTAHFFTRADGTSSFFVSDFIEVDTNVTRHLPGELASSEWSAMVLHYLGLDHIGHKTGPQGPNMLPKQREMDDVVRMVFDAMRSEAHHARTLLVLMGDHGMNAGGNHGGSAPGETEPALVFASPVFEESGRRGREYECPTLPREGTEFHFYSKISQTDVVPVLAGLMGLPISKNSLGVFPPELLGVMPEEEMLPLLRRNARQIMRLVRAKYGAERSDQRIAAYRHALEADVDACQAVSGDEEQLLCEWARISHGEATKLDSNDPARAQQDLYNFLHHAQETMSDTASSYDIPRMVAGMAIVSIALVAAFLSFPSLWPPGGAGLFFTAICALYGVMMFASSYVEEEQHFWYWLTPAWIALLVGKSCVAQLSSSSANQRTIALTAGAILLATHRVTVRWNQTGQKHAGDQDIVHTVFPDHHIIMWLLVLATYIANGALLHLRTLDGLFVMEISAFLTTALVTLGIVFKLNFTQADAPELVRGLAEVIRRYSEPFSLVMQARGVFFVLAVTTAGVLIMAVVMAQRRTKAGKLTTVMDEEHPPIALPERLHYLLTLFLMTQTRAPNVPVFLLLEIQRACLSRLIQTDNGKERSTTALQIATSALLFSHVSYFCLGGSNSISSIDLSNAYNGVADYNIAAVGVLLFASNWAGAIWWCSAAVLLLTNTARPVQAGKEEAAPVPNPTPSRHQLSNPKDTKSNPMAPPQEADRDRDWVIIERQKLHADAVSSLQQTKPQPPSRHSSSPDGISFTNTYAVYITAMTTFVACGLLAVMAACTALRTHLFIWTVFSPKYLYAMAWAVGWHLLVNVGVGGVLFGGRGWVS